MLGSRNLLTVALLLSVPLAACFAQLAGSRAGAPEQAARSADLPLLAREAAETFITFEGRSELRAAPSEIRMVLAVTAEAETARRCQESIRKTIDELKAAWADVEINSDDVVEDFISVLPRYEWQIEQRGGVDVGVERKVGYRMQTNLHVAVPDERAAQSALAAAFDHEVTDIIAFDYWNAELDDLKVQARAQAMESARNKADFILRELFEVTPPVINVQEQTTVVPPENQYQSFTNVVDQEVSPAPRRDLPLFGAGRPRNTYYRGLGANSDVQTPGLPMRPQIAVVSTVRIYFQSPAAERARSEKARKKAANAADENAATGV
jgi:uncharacterized protein